MSLNNVQGFIFNGTDTADYDLKVKTLTNPLAPFRRMAKETVSGRDGNYKFIDGFDNRIVRFQVSCSAVMPHARRLTLRDIMELFVLNTEADLVIKYESQLKYRATLTNIIETDIDPAADTFVLEFDCQPLKLANYDMDTMTWEKAVMIWDLADFTWAGATKLFEDVSDTDVLSVENLGTYEARPIIALENGTATEISLTDDNGNTATFSSLSGTVYIDCDNQIVYSLSGDTKVNEMSSFSGDFLVLNTGTNTIDVAGTSISSVDVDFDFLERFI
jgi:phage-related protein